MKVAVEDNRVVISDGGHLVADLGYDEAYQLGEAILEAAEELELEGNVAEGCGATLKVEAGCGFRCDGRYGFPLEEESETT